MPEINKDQYDFKVSIFKDAKLALQVADNNGVWMMPAKVPGKTRPVYIVIDAFLAEAIQSGAIQFDDKYPVNLTKKEMELLRLGLLKQERWLEKRIAECQRRAQLPHGTRKAIDSWLKEEEERKEA